MAEAVAESAASVAFRTVISSTNLHTYELLVQQTKKKNLHQQKNVRFETNHVTQQLAFVSFLVAHLPGPVDELYARHPLVDGEIHFAGKVVDVANERAHDLSQACISLGTHGLDDVLRPLLVETDIFCRLSVGGGHVCCCCGGVRGGEMDNGWLSEGHKAV